MTDRKRYKTLLLSSFPDDFFRALIGGIAKAYRDAHNLCYTLLEKPEAHDLLGHVRRALVEDAMQATADRFTAAVTCTARQNDAPNYSHRVISSGGLLLVEGYHRSAQHMLRTAKHRREYASLQGELWPSMAPASLIAAEEGDVVFGIIQHGAHPEDLRRPGYVKVFFPNADCDRYETGVDLLSRFPLDIPSTSEEKLADDVQMFPRRKRKEEDDA